MKPSVRSFGTLGRNVGRQAFADLGFTNPRVVQNLSVPELYEKAIQMAPLRVPSQRETISSSGALIAYSDKCTGRSPKEKRVVVEETSKDHVWWGDVEDPKKSPNMPISEKSYAINRNRAVSYLNTVPQIFIVDGYASWDERYKITCRIICSKAYHALFMRNMLIRPTPEQIEKDFKNGAQWTIINGGEFTADPENTPGVKRDVSVALNIKRKELTILGTLYAGCMKKGLFTILNYLCPKQMGMLSMHASCTEGEKQDTTLYFGLSGTGKTTLSADPKRLMLGDDEHVWSNDGIFNVEGGCYAKCINLDRKTEPDIYNAIRFGSVLENIIYDEHTRDVDFTDGRITENTRLSYPLEFIPYAKLPSLGAHPKNIIFLTCDASGVLPPVSKLNPSQTSYHFINGYTSKVAGTEVGIKDPVRTFSACFGEAFIVLHPNEYANMLAANMKKHKVNTWLLNTGWVGGKYGVGKRMDLPSTRRIIDSIHDGTIEKAKWRNFPVFDVQVPDNIPGVDPKILWPQNGWSNQEEYTSTLRKLADAFQKNFKKYEAGCTQEIRNAGPKY